MFQTDEDKERKRQEALERKAALYQELQNRVNLDDEAANDTYDVDFIGKALQGDATILDQDATAEPIRAEPLRESLPSISLAPLIWVITDPLLVLLTFRT